MVQEYSVAVDSADSGASSDAPKKKRSVFSLSSNSTKRSTSPQTSDAHATVKARRRSARKHTWKQIAAFAEQMAMETEDDDDTEADFNIRHSGEDEEERVEYTETGVMRLRRAVTLETRRSGRSIVRKTVGNAVGKSGMESEVLQRVAMEDEWQMVSCASLPFTIVFFLIFTSFFQRHYRVTEIFLAEEPIRRLFSTPAEEIDLPIHIYKWLEDACFPNLWLLEDEMRTHNHKEVQLEYQELVGGVKVSTTRARPEPCAHSDLIGQSQCYSDIVQATNGNAFLAPLGRRLRPWSWSPGNTSAASPPVAAAHGGEAVAGADGNAPAARQQPQTRQLPHEDRRFLRSGESPEGGGRATSSTKPRSEKGASRGRRLVPSRRQKVSTGLQAFRQLQKERRLRHNRPEIAGMTPRHKDGNYSMLVLPKSRELSDVQAEVLRWKEVGVITEQTLTFAIEFMVLNEQLPTELLTHVGIIFSVHRGGEVFVETAVTTVVLSKIADDALQSLLGFLFVVLLFVFSSMLFARSYIRYREKKCRANFFRFWNLLECFINAWGWVLLLCFVLERIFIWSLKVDIDDHRKQRAAMPPWEQYGMDEQAAIDLLDRVSSLLDLSKAVQTLVSLYQILLVLRFFLASRGQPRLAVVLSTISKASVDLLHLLVVFIIVFIAFTVSGHLLFGRRLEEFATFQGSFADCLQIVIERQYDWEKFTEQDQWTSTLWVWSFLMLVVIVLVNIFLAMIFDTYGDVRSSVGHSATLWQTTKILATSLQHMLHIGATQGQRWVPNKEFVRVVKKMKTQYVTPWMVKDALTDIANRQVNYLFNLAKNRLESAVLRGHKMTLASVTSSIFLSVGKLHTEIGEIEEHARTRIEEQDMLRMGSNYSMSGGGSTSGPAAAPRIPSEPPQWVKLKVLPHFQKQKILLTQVHVQISRVERELRLRGMGEGLAPAPLAPKPLKVHAPTPKGQQQATALGKANGMVPAAARAGLTSFSPLSRLTTPVDTAVTPSICSTPPICASPLTTPKNSIRMPEDSSPLLHPNGASSLKSSVGVRPAKPVHHD